MTEMMGVSLSLPPKGGACVGIGRVKGDKKTAKPFRRFLKACVGIGRVKGVNWQIKKDPVVAESQN